MKILNLVITFLLLLENNFDSSAFVNAQNNKKINPNLNKNILDNSFDAFGDMK